MDRYFLTIFYLIGLLLLLCDTGDGFLHHAAVNSGRGSSFPALTTSLYHMNKANIININTNLYIRNCREAMTIGTSFPSSSSRRMSQRLYGSNEEDDVDDGSIGKLVEKTNIENESNIFMRQWMNLSPENRDDIRTTTFSFLFALFIRCFIIEPRFIPSLSMFPTFDVGDQLLVDKVSRMKQYQRKDVIVFNPSDTYTELTGNKEALIKRIVGIAGDSVEIKNNRVYVNGVEQDEPYVNERPDYELPLLKVPPGYLLVLGDNRNHSFDSHIWGFLPSENVIGRAVVKYWPPWRVGLVE